MKIKTLLSCTAILLATLLLLGGAQALLVPKHMETTREGALIAEYYDEKQPAHDVLFLGDCEVYESFTPPTLWEEYGITSYVRGSAQQLPWQSYYLLEDTLRYETPRAVVFNVYALRYGTPQNEAYNRMTLDGMRWSGVKARAIRASMTEEESFLSYLFPLLRYHGRWDELSGEDLRYFFSRDTVSHNGYLMQTGVLAMGEDAIEPTPLADPTLPSVAMEYLDAMRELCTERGIELILVKAPTNNWRYHWYDEWEAQVVAYAEQYALAYYNFIPVGEEIGLDWSTDTYDRGAHLNVYGAEKLTSYFGAILAEQHAIPDHRGDATLSALWEGKLALYRSARDAGTLAQ